MPQIVTCPSCLKQYQVAENTLGKRVQCKQCGTAFTVRDDGRFFDPLAGSGHSSTIAAPATAKESRISNPSGGPTDNKIRLGSGGLIGFSAIFLIISVIIYAFSGTAFIIVLALIPVTLVLGITGLIAPNVIRGMGQYGAHLPSYYKFIGWGVLGISLLLMVPLMIVMYQAGFRSNNVPRPRPRFRHIAPAPPASPSQDQLVNKDPAAKRRKSYPVSIDVPDHSVFVPADAKLTPGTKLEACYSGVWSPITTLSENDDGSLNVRWDEWGPQFDCSMIRSELLIRREVLQELGYPMANLPAVTPRSTPPRNPAGLASQQAQKPLKNYPVAIAVPADSQLVPAGAKLPSGTRLQACYFGKWNPITLLAENEDGTLTVRWDDYGEAFDCRMVRSELIVKRSLLK